MKTIILIDPYTGGHHMMYLRLVSQAFLEMGCRLVVCCDAPEKVSDWLAEQGALQRTKFVGIKIWEKDAIRLPGIKQSPQPLNVLQRWYHARQIVNQAITKLEGVVPDLVFFNWIDSQLSRYIPSPLIDIIFPYAWAGICFQPKLTHKESPDTSSSWFNYHQVFNAARCQGIGVLDEAQATELQQYSRCPMVVLPDVTDDSPPDHTFGLLQDLKQRSQGKPIIGLIGSLNKRKGLLTLLKAAQLGQNDDYFFVFAGQLSQYNLSPDELSFIQQMVRSNPPNCYFHLELIPDEPQFNALIDACDILFAAYENFPYSSNILTKAAVFGKFVIASEGYCIGKRVQQFGLGLTIPEGDVGQCIAAIQKLCLQVKVKTQILKPDFEGYKTLHSVQQVRQVLENLLPSLISTSMESS